MNITLYYAPITCALALFITLTEAGANFRGPFTQFAQRPAACALTGVSGALEITLARAHYVLSCPQFPTYRCTAVTGTSCQQHIFASQRISNSVPYAVFAFARSRPPLTR